MRKITVGGASPQDNGAAFVADNATLAGAVELEENCSIWYGAVLRADTGRIRVGRGSNVQDNAVLHTGPGLGRGAVVAAGALVPEKMVVPDGTVVMGVPAKVHGTAREDLAADNLANADEYRALAKAHAAAQTREKD